MPTLKERMAPTGQRRFPQQFKAHGNPKALPEDHPALSEKRTIFPSSVVDATASPRLLVSGHNSRKIGRQVTVGRWKGMPIYTLTLEERATCPTTCHHWRDCYGDAMPFARRHRHGPEFERLLAQEIDMKARQHPKGFVVRLHVLGDFYSFEYALLWKKFLDTYWPLCIFGYTARTPKDQIGAMVAYMNDVYSGRCRIRVSVPYHGQALHNFDLPYPVPQAITVANEADIPRGMPSPFLCPAQRRDDKFCGNCAACWESPHVVAFKLHGRKTRGKAVATPPAE